MDSLRFTVSHCLYTPLLHPTLLTMAILHDPISSDANYRSLVAITVVYILLFILGVPLLCGYLLFHFREHILVDRHASAAQPGLVAECLGFLYACFKPRLYWFELLWFVRRLLLLVALVVMPDDNPFKNPMVVSVFAVFLALHQQYHPFIRKEENLLEAVSLLMLLITFVGMGEPSYNSEEENTVKDSETTVAVTTVTMLGNGAVTMLFVAFLFVPFFQTVRNKWKAMKRYNYE